MRDAAGKGVKLPRQLLDQLLAQSDAVPQLTSTYQKSSTRRENRKAQRVEKKRSQKANTGAKNKLKKLAAAHASSSDVVRDIGSQSTRRSKSGHEPEKTIVEKHPAILGVDERTAASQKSQAAHRIPKRVRDQLAEDDAQIDALERALRVKGKKKLPKLFGDGLDDILADLDDSLQESQDWHPQYTHTEETDLPLTHQVPSSPALNRTSHDEAAGPPLKHTRKSIESHGDASRETAAIPRSILKKENPYRPPQAQETRVEKYVPPSVMNDNVPEERDVLAIRKRLQGLLNRLSEANILAIVTDLEVVYQSNPRQQVSAILLDLLIGLVCDESLLSDTFIILHSGFVAALYKTMGSTFGAQLVQRLVEEFDRLYQVRLDEDSGGKRLINVVSLLTQLYNFQVLGASVIFDLIRLIGAELSDRNTELLLKIVRNSGPQLRQDDPSALKDIVLIVQKSMENAGGIENLPIRTRFMIEAIHDLKNNRVKTGQAASAIAVEHAAKLKRTLALLNNRTLRATEPLRITLSDIKNADQRGKWWLVGSSYRDAETIPKEGPTEPTKSLERSQDRQEQAQPDDIVSNVLLLAKEHRMNTDIRRSIFVTLLTATDYEDACVHLLKLRLRKSQEMEIPKVLLHCAGAEKSHNPYYTLISRQLCRDRKFRVSFQFCLWDFFKDISADEDDESSMTAEGPSSREIVNVSKLYGTLIAEGALNLSVLKNVNFLYLSPRLSTFLELLFITVITQSQSRTGESGTESSLPRCFSELESTPELANGIRYFLKKVVRQSDMAGSKTASAIVKRGCKVADGVLKAITPPQQLNEDAASGLC